jgi:hypothetical protein
MIIDKNINSLLSIDDTNLDWEIDWTINFPEGAQRIEVQVNFWNLINNEKVNKNHRVLYIPTGVVGDDVSFSRADIKNMFFQTHPYLVK